MTHTITVESHLGSFTHPPPLPAQQGYLATGEVAVIVTTTPVVTPVNYLFTATQLLLRNIETNRYYLLQAYGGNATAQLLYETEVVDPVAAVMIPNSGVNFEFTVDGELRIAHESSGNFHAPYVVTDTGAAQTWLGTGVPSNPGSFSTTGLNFTIVGSTLFLNNLIAGEPRVPVLVGAHGAQSLELL